MGLSLLEVNLQDLFFQLFQILVQLKAGPNSGERRNKNVCFIAWNDFFIHFTHINLHDLFSADYYILNVVPCLFDNPMQLTRACDGKSLRLVGFLTKFAPEARIKE